MHGARHDTGERRTGLLLTAILCGGLLAPSSAAASDADEESDRLFYEGNTLIAAGKTSEACVKFEQSLALRRRGGTLLNLALCREAEGAISVALPLFVEAREIASRDGRAARVETATQHIEALRPRVAWLTIVASAANVANAPRTAPPAAAPVAHHEGLSPPAPPPRDRPARTGEQPRSETLSHALQLGAMARVDVDPIHLGVRAAVGPTFGLGEHVSIGVSALLGRDLGVEPQITLFIVGRGPYKPFVNVGAPVFFSDGVQAGPRGALGLEWDLNSHLGLFAQLGGAYFPAAPAGVARAVLLPSAGAEARF